MKFTTTAMFAALAAFASAGHAVAAGGDLIVGIAGDLRSPYPGFANEDSSLAVQQHVYEGLVAWKENGDVGPMLAVDLPTVSEDGKVYTFTVRDGITFHDGSPVTAAAVVASWNFLLNPEKGWGCRQYFNGTGALKVDEVVATGDMTVEFRLAEAAPGLLTQMARADCGEGGIMAPAVYGGESGPVIGTGPFKVREIRPGERVVLERFDGYVPREEATDGYTGRKEALLDSVTFMVIPDPAAQFSALMAGETHIWTQMNVTYADQIAATAGFKVTSVPIPSINSFAIQTETGPLTNPALRAAISLSLDRQGMIDAVLAGRGVPSGSPVPAASPYFGDVEKSGWAYDATRVAELLREAGYNGEKITVTTNKNYSVMYETGVMVQAMMQAAGINAELEVLDFATTAQKYARGDYQMLAWNYAPTLDPALILDRFTGDKAQAPSKIWTNPEARALVNKLLAAPAEERQAVYDEIHQLFLKDTPKLIWASAYASDAFSEKVQGFATWPGRKLRLWNVSLAQ